MENGLVVNPACKNTVTVEGGVERCEFIGNECQTAFVGTLVNEKSVVVWELEILSGPENGEDLVMGIAPHTEDVPLSKRTLSEDGACAFRIKRAENGMLHLRLQGVMENVTRPWDDLLLSKYPLAIQVEVDTQKHMLSLAVGRQKVAAVISDVHGPLHVGVMGSAGASFYSKGFYHLLSGTKLRTGNNYFKFFHACDKKK